MPKAYGIVVTNTSHTSDEEARPSAEVQSSTSNGIALGHFVELRCPNCNARSNTGSVCANCSRPRPTSAPNTVALGHLLGDSGSPSDTPFRLKGVYFFLGVSLADAFLAMFQGAVLVLGVAATIYAITQLMARRPRGIILASLIAGAKVLAALYLLASAKVDAEQVGAAFVALGGAYVIIALHTQPVRVLFPDY